MESSEQLGFPVRVGGLRPLMEAVLDAVFHALQGKGVRRRREKLVSAPTKPDYSSEMKPQMLKDYLRRPVASVDTA